MNMSTFIDSLTANENTSDVITAVDTALTNKKYDEGFDRSFYFTIKFTLNKTYKPLYVDKLVFDDTFIGSWGWKGYKVIYNSVSQKTNIIVNLYPELEVKEVVWG